MNLTLKGFSQDVVLQNKDAIQHYLVFDKGDGSEMRLPVPEETTKELIRLIYAPPARTSSAERETEPIDTGDEYLAKTAATEFSAIDADEEEDEHIEQYESEEDEDVPADESEVPSI